MKDMITYVNDFVKQVNLDESLASMLREKIKDGIKKFMPLDYFYLTELCNPVHSYWIRMRKDILPPAELKRVWAWGNRLHRLANYWFRKLPKYIVEEGALDGIFVGLRGVRGRIDALMGESILEYKTKEELPEKDAEKLFLKYPQDIEQVAFYSILYQSPPKINYLIFISNKEPFEIMAFKIIIKDPNKIKILLESRMKKLKRALEEKDPSGLEQCRYYDKGCQFKDSSVCSCKDLKDSKKDEFKGSIEVSYDEEFTNKLKELQKEAIQEKNFFTTKDIIAPRKYGIKEEFERDELKEKAKNYLWTLVRRMDFRLLPSEMDHIKNSLKESKLQVAYRWVKIQTSTKPKSDILPYLITVNTTEEIRNRPSKYHLAELGIILSVYGKNTGLIFNISPKLENCVRVFKVTYRENGKILTRVKEIIQNIEKGNIEQLPPNPWWMSK